MATMVFPLLKKDSGINTRQLMAGALVGLLVLVAVIISFDLAQLIGRGEDGKEAMQLLHKMRRPFFRIQKVETRMLVGSSHYADVEGLNDAINAVNTIFTVILEQSRYNQQLNVRILHQKNVFNEWVEAEYFLFAIFPEITAGYSDEASNEKLLHAIAKTSSIFLDILNIIEEAEDLIKKDISKGHQAFLILLILLGLYILYLLSLVFLYRQPDRKQNLADAKPEAFITPLVIISILLVSIVLFFYSVSRKQVNDEFDSTVQLVEEKYFRLVDEETARLNSLTSLIASNSSLQQAWMGKDRKRLYEVSSSIFSHLYAEQNITHFYYHKVDGTNFLRVHKPDIYGDQIDRLTLEKSLAGSQLSSGFELGPLGTFTLRVVRPWIISGKLEGFIELGVDVDYLIPKLASNVGMKFIVVLDKGNIDRSAWESWKNDHFVETDWDLFADVIVAGETYPGLGKVLQEFLSRATSSQKVLQEVLEKAATNRKVLARNVYVGNKLHRGGYLQLLDIANQHVGYLFFFQDISGEMEKINRTILYIIVLGIILMYVIVRREQTEENLRFAASTFDTQDGIIITDKDGTILKVNRAFTRITGYSEDDVIGRNTNILKSGYHKPEFYQEMWRTLRETGNWKGAVWNRRKNGDVCPEWLSITAIMDVEGAVTHLVGHFTDLGDLNRKEDDIRNVNVS